MAESHKTALHCKRFVASDLKTLYKALYPVKLKFINFGLEIDVEKSDLDRIGKDKIDFGERLLEVLDHRLRQPQAFTCSDIDDALRSETVDEPVFAESLWKRFQSIEEARLTGNSTECSGEESGRFLSAEPHQDLQQNKPNFNGDQQFAAKKPAEFVKKASATFLSQDPPNQVLLEYKKYLQAVYRAKPQADKYLPIQTSPYIKLAIIRKTSNQERDELVKLTQHGGVDQILESNQCINIEELLRSDNSKCNPVRFVLVEGPPGIGKSTFALEFCRRWDEIESLGEYFIVLFIKLREKWVLKATSLHELFRCPHDPELSKMIAKELGSTQGVKLLLVLDGFDEISHAFHEDSIVKSILCREVLPECTIILTTRPAAKAKLDSICQPQVDKHVQIIGFTEEEKIEFINKFFSEEPELQADFLKNMFLVPHIKSMMYIPLNCAILAQVYKESRNSRHLSLPRTRTQLYKALTHCILLRYISGREGNRVDDISELPEGLKEDDMERFQVLAKFAFDKYQAKGSRMITFFKEDIPERFVHFGFMTESREMYVETGIERTFSFVHLSLQEYLVAWHMANNYSTEFQIAYHKIAIERDQITYGIDSADNKKIQLEIEEENDVIESLKEVTESLMEPALFLAGITGFKSRSEDGKNCWEEYLTQQTNEVLNNGRVFTSIYEAQNSIIPRNYFDSEHNDGHKRNISIGSYSIVVSQSPYDCYALSYCIVSSAKEFNVSVTIVSDYDTSLLETFISGVNDHCCHTFKIKHFKLKLETSTREAYNCLICLGLKKFFRRFEEVEIDYDCECGYGIQLFLKSLLHLKSLKVDVGYFPEIEYPLDWFSAVKSLPELEVFEVSSDVGCSPPPYDLEFWPAKHNIKEFTVNVYLPSYTIYDLHSPTNRMIRDLLKSMLTSNQLTKLVLGYVSRENMQHVRNILLQCRNLVSMELNKSSLGYDGILFISDALKCNTTLKKLAISDDLHAPLRERKLRVIIMPMFLKAERCPLPDRATCTQFLLELNSILGDNNTLEEIDIQTEQFLPLTTGMRGSYIEWTGHGPLQQYNLGAVARGSSCNLKRSFSLSNLTRPKTIFFWDRRSKEHSVNSRQIQINLGTLFPTPKERPKLFSFTNPDTQVLTSFSKLDTRLKECLQLNDFNQYLDLLKRSSKAHLDYDSDW